MNKIIVDGYNVIFSVSALRSLVENSLEEARDRLLNQVRSYVIRRNVYVTIVFDGTQPPFSGPEPDYGSRLSVIFSRSPFKADPMIKELIRREGGKNALSVVTEDNDILRYAKDHKTKGLSPERFFDRISVRTEARQLSKKHNPMIDDEELDDWMRLFNEGSDN